MTRPAAPTQMIILPIQETLLIDQPSTQEGQTWSQILGILENFAGFLRMDWGRHVEDSGLVHLHIVRESLHQHYALLASSAWQQIGERLQSLGIVDLASLVVRHAMMEEFSPNEGKRAPVTGTAIYLTPDQAGWMKTWELWTTIVAAVPGCIGVRGGWMVEPVESQPGYVVFVGWESVKIHDAYHHTKHFRQRASILREHNQGFREYGHIAFSQSVVRGQAKL
ncbi:uncharacterized protein N7469_002737 [Penicillium citrinum]|uniref:ABM domain-containing protein n=2 Tax=Penicillium TaxID=5073 RepID=A0A9W9TTT3_PENCI|nr:uncharacterized protein N7469_002737 [Penicillium citrinum]KAJ5241146.1 hypothetical protein N7469_002737 [Penicillium citrinum]KAJ5586145.1 hypothetical protein N7450_005932 [Penicillium hetheringtonii]